MKRRLFLLFAFALVIWGCQPDIYLPEYHEPTEWLERTDGFEDRYSLEQMVVLSRHNIRTPLVGKGSVLVRLTDPSYQWHQWTESTSHLTSKGERLEGKMGDFFREWLIKKDLLQQYSKDNSSFRFYANAKQRCQLTARTFADAVFPGLNPEVEMKVAFDKMDPVFNPQITKLPEGYQEKASQEINALMGDLDAGISAQYALLQRVIGLENAPAYPDTSSFAQFPSSVGFKLNAEPYMNGGLKMACTVSDALVLQYYEEQDPLVAAFGHNLDNQGWTDIALVKEWYGDALFTAPSVCVNVAHPLLEEMLSELRREGRVFSFLCGHDSNIGSVLASLEAEDYNLRNTIEKKTPIGSKVIVEKFLGKDGKEYADIWLVYASTDQIRQERSLSYSTPPVAARISLKGLNANADGLYLLQEVEARFSKAIAAYDAL